MSHGPRSDLQSTGDRASFRRTAQEKQEKLTGNRVRNNAKEFLRVYNYTLTFSPCGQTRSTFHRHSVAVARPQPRANGLPYALLRMRQPPPTSSAANKRRFGYKNIECYPTPLQRPREIYRQRFRGSRKENAEKKMPSHRLSL